MNVRFVVSVCGVMKVRDFERQMSLVCWMRLGVRFICEGLGMKQLSRFKISQFFYKKKTVTIKNY